MFVNHLALKKSQFLQFCLVECQKRIDETNDYLKDLCGFYGFSFIDNSSITENYLHHNEIHLNKVGSFLLGQNFVGHFNESI